MVPNFSSRASPLQKQSDIWQGVLDELKKLRDALPTPSPPKFRDSGRDRMDSSKFNFEFPDGSVCTVRIPSTFYYALTSSIGVGLYARVLILMSICDAQIQYCIGDGD